MVRRALGRLLTPKIAWSQGMRLWFPNWTRYNLIKCLLPAAAAAAAAAGTALCRFSAGARCPASCGTMAVAGPVCRPRRFRCEGETRDARVDGGAAIADLDSDPARGALS